MNNLIPLVLIIFETFSECGCSTSGSSSTSCTTSGVCTCKPNVIGIKCTGCETGFYGFPNCQGIIYNIWMI